MKIRLLSTSKILLCLAVLSGGVVFAQGFTGRYQHVTEDGQRLNLVLQQEGAWYWGYLMPDYGVFVTLNHDREQSGTTRLVGELDTDEAIAFEAEHKDDGLELTLADTETFIFSRIANQGWQQDDSLFLQMLSLVPDSPLARDGFPFISYVNLWALTDAQNVPVLNNQEDYETSSADARASWLQGLNRVGFGDGDLLQGMGLFEKFDHMPARVGFSFFEIQTVLSTARRGELLLAADVSAERMQEPLLARAFEGSQVEGLPLFSRYDDDELNLSARDLADPFGGQLGRAARIAAVDGFIVNTPASAQSIGMLESHLAKRPSLADAADVRSLVQALEPYGTLLQAGFYNPTDIGFISVDPLAGLLQVAPETSPAEALQNDSAEARAEPGSLPFFGLTLLADVAKDEDQLALWALLFSDLTSAEQAAEVLPSRLTASFAKMGDLTPELVVPSISQGEAGLYVVVFGARHASLVEGGTSALSYWQWFMNTRDFQLLAVEP